jgi:hypothetical protein
MYKFLACYAYVNYVHVLNSSFVLVVSVFVSRLLGMVFGPK